jgi:GGDEF domain-containing protein
MPVLWVGVLAVTISGICVAVAFMLRHASVIARPFAIQSVRTAMPRIQEEMTRARRYDRALSLAVLEIQNEELVRQIRILISGAGLSLLVAQRQASRVARIVFALIGCVLRDAIRETDVAAYDPASDRYVLLLPETTKAEAQQLVERIQDMLSSRTAAESRAGVAQFAIDGLTFEAVLNAAILACGPDRDTVVSKTAA